MPALAHGASGRDLSGGSYLEKLLAEYGLQGAYRHEFGAPGP
jgi:hypothetical protein